MQFSIEELNKLKAIYKKEYGYELSDDEAMSLAIRLLTLFNILVRPIKSISNKEKKGYNNN